MGKIKKEYREERMERKESYGYTSRTSESSQSSGSSDLSSSDSESSGSTARKRKHIRKKSKYKKEKKRRSDSEDEVEYVEKEKRKRRKHARHKDIDEASSDEEYTRSEERKHKSRKHSKHHHRKHKHKHRRHRHHRSEEEYQEKRRGSSLERNDNRKDRGEWDERKAVYEKERKSDRDGDRKLKKDEKRNREKGENRQVKSKWDDDEDIQYNINKRIKPDPDDEEDRDRYKDRQEKEKVKKWKDREEGSENGRWGMADGAQNIKKEEDSQDQEEVHKPNMGLSGKLSEDTNTFNGVVIKYSQPPEARKPKRRWRWYIFKGEEDLPFLPLHRQSAYLIGRDRKVADIPTDHPSCSKQHAVLQYRLVGYEREDGTKGRTVKPYILDLESANGTYVNNRRIDSRRFVELIEKDVVKFGYSSREYILLHEGSKGDDADAPDMGVDLSPVSLLRS